MEGGGVVVVPVDEKEGRRIAIRPMLSERLTKMWVGVWGLGFGVWGLGFEVWVLGLQHVYTHTHPCSHAYPHTQLNLLPSVHTHTCIHIQVYTHTHMYTHIDITSRAYERVGVNLNRQKPLLNPTASPFLKVILNPKP